MHLIYTKPYFQNYLKLSIRIFQKQYPKSVSYAEHEDWQNFLQILKSANVSKMLIYEEMYIGNMFVKYGHALITENSPSEEQVKQRHRVLEEIII